MSYAHQLTLRVINLPPCFPIILGVSAPFTWQAQVNCRCIWPRLSKRTIGLRSDIRPHVQTGFQTTHFQGGYIKMFCTTFLKDSEIRFSDLKRQATQCRIPYRYPIDENSLVSLPKKLDCTHGKNFSLKSQDFILVFSTVLLKLSVINHSTSLIN